MTEKKTRKYPREKDDRVITFHVHQDESRSKYQGVLVDSSNEGFSFLSTKSLTAGEIIALEIKKDQPVQCQIGLVVWTEQIKDSLYKVGVECID